MASVENNCNHIGRLAADPELRYTGGGKAVCSFRLAVDNPFVKKEDGTNGADFFDFVAWEKDAEFVSNHCGKGDQVAVQSRAQARSYEDKEGVKRKVVEFVIGNIKGLGKAKPKVDG
jgi:single-strand DNA-binding protein